MDCGKVSFCMSMFRADEIRKKISESNSEAGNTMEGDSNSTPRMQSNEEIVDELTKSLKGSCSTSNDAKIKEKNVDDDDPGENIGRDHDDEDQNVRKPRKAENAKAVDNDEEEEEEEDFVDEVNLKDRDFSLTDEEKEVR